MTSDVPEQPPKDDSALRDLVRQGQLAWRLFTDARTPMIAKVIPALAVVYLLWPVDLIPDFPILGQLDDLAVMVLALRLFIELAPSDVRDEHRARRDADPDSVSATYRVKDD